MTIPGKIYAKVRRQSVLAANDLRALAGMNESLYKNARGARIVVYHGICKTRHTRFNSIFLRLKTFEKHLQFYKKYFHIISLDDYYAQRFDNSRLNICLSFDDGFANNYKYVLPLITKYQAPATFFITGIREAGYDFLWNDFLGFLQKYGPAKLRFENEWFYRDRHRRYLSPATGKALKDMLRSAGFDKKAEFIRLFTPVASLVNKRKEEDYWLQMTQQEIAALAASPLATIGCHGYYHNDLAAIPPGDAGNEMIHARQYLENIIQKNVNAIAFPYGAYTRDVVTEAKAAGLHQLLALDFLYPEDRADPSMRERLTINPYISIANQALAIINGKYDC